MALPNPDCPSFKAWPGVAARRERREQQSPYRSGGGHLTQGLLASLPPDLAHVAVRDPLAVIRKGITLNGLRNIRNLLKAKFGERYMSMSTAEVNVEWVEQVTAQRKCRLLEAVELVKAADVAAPTYFVSHAWKNKVSLLLDFILDSFLADASGSVAVWLDILAVNQHEGTYDHQHDIGAFSNVIQACAGGTIVVMDVAAVNPAKRGWCIYEWSHTLAAHGSDGLHIRFLDAAELKSVVDSIDIGAAECQFEEDKEMILRSVVAQHGSAQAFDTALKLQLLLEPLSFSTDLRRLRHRAEGTVWTLEPVERWLAQGVTGSPVLCISAGAGEGKSTISAALVDSSEAIGAKGASLLSRTAANLAQQPPECEPGAPRRPSSENSIAVFHFLKYNDQRRLDPVRVIKTLAFQLAHRLPEVSTAILAADAATVAQLHDVEQAFQLLLWGPLRQLQAPPAQLVLLIDALDEADSLQLGSSSEMSEYPPVLGNKALQLIANQLAALPPYVRFIFTTRPEAASGQVLPCLHRTFGEGGVTVLRPSELRQQQLQATSGAAAASGGVMLYHTARDAALLQQVVAVPPLPATPSIDDVYDLYGRTFAASFSRLDVETTNRLHTLVNVLHAAKEPLAQATLEQLGLGGVVELLPGHTVLFFVDEHHLYATHKSIGDWLGDSAKSGAFAANVRRGHEAMGMHLTREWASSRHASPYTLKYAVGHLVAALHGSAAAGTNDVVAAALDGLLSDFPFMHAVVRAGQASEAIRALSSLHSQTKMSYDVQRWMKLEQYNLLGMSSVGQLANACLAVAPPSSKLYDLALTSVMPPWRTRLVLPKSASEWLPCTSVLKGHTADVVSVAFSPDGKALASASEDYTVRLWDAATGQSAGILQGHAAVVSIVVFSLDGTTLASGSHDNTVRLWDAATGQCTGMLQGLTCAAIHCVAFSPDGQVLASSGNGDSSTVRLWDPAMGQCTGTLHGHTSAVNSVAFSPDGMMLASGSDDKTVRLWGAATGPCTCTLQGHTGVVFTVAFSPDGKTLASGSRDKTVRLWDAATGQCISTLQGHTDLVRSVAFSPDGKMLASGCWDETVRLWDPARGQCTGVLQGDRAICSVAFSPDGRTLASGSCEDKTVRLWDAVTAQQCTSTLQQGHTGIVNSVAFSPDGRMIASGIEKTVRLCDTATGHCTDPLIGHANRVACVAFSADGTTLASGSDDKTVRLWDPAMGQCTGTLHGHTSGVNSVAFSPDGMMLASGSRDKTVRLWDAATGQCTSTLQGHTNTVSSVAFSPDGRMLASASSDVSVRLWDVATGQCTGTLQGYTNIVCSVAFSPDGKTLASGNGAHTVCTWDTATGQCTRTLRGHTDLVRSVAFSPDGETLASGCWDNTVRLWDAATGQCTSTLQQGHTDTVSSVAFSPDGRMLATGSRDQTVRLWECWPSSLSLTS